MRNAHVCPGPRALVLVAVMVAGCASSKSASVETSNTVQKAYAPDRLIELGRAHRRAGDATRAEQYFAAVLENREATDSQRGIAMKEVLATCIEAQRFRVAIDYAEPELRKHPNDLALMRLVASLAAAVGDGLKARDMYERLLLRAPVESEAELGLARVLRDAFADRREATVHFERYLELAPSGPYAAEARTFVAEASP